MKQYYSVTYEVGNGIFSANIAHAQSVDDVKDHYAQYENVSVRLATDMDVRSAQRRRMPIVEIDPVYYHFYYECNYLFTVAGKHAANEIVGQVTTAFNACGLSWSDSGDVLHTDAKQAVPSIRAGADPYAPKVYREATQALIEEHLQNTCYVWAQEQEQKLSVLVVEPKKAPYRKTIDAGLASLQREVGGDIQAVYPFDDPVAIVCDEESKLKGSELNRALRDEDGKIYDIIAGTFLVVGLGEEDFCSLTPTLMEKFATHFQTPEAFVRMGDQIISVPIAEKPKTRLEELIAEAQKNAPEQTQAPKIRTKSAELEL